MIIIKTEKPEIILNNQVIPVPTKIMLNPSLSGNDINIGICPMFLTRPYKPAVAEVPEVKDKDGKVTQPYVAPVAEREAVYDVRYSYNFVITKSGESLMEYCKDFMVNVTNDVVAHLKKDMRPGFEYECQIEL